MAKTEDAISVAAAQPLYKSRALSSAKRLNYRKRFCRTSANVPFQRLAALALYSPIEQARSLANVRSALFSSAPHLRREAGGVKYTALLPLGVSLISPSMPYQHSVCGAQWSD